jgi:predicted short-subunit dehydrogenase-like oxidoreductase (DUF2520 family)
MIQKIVLIGAGNLATQLGKALRKNGLHVAQVYSRTEASAKALAHVLECPYTTSFDELEPCDLCLVSVKDDALETVLRQIQLETIVVHTAGSIPMELLSAYFKNFGVFYPLQTFSKQREVDFLSIPLCLEASSDDVFAELQALGEKLSTSVQSVNSEERKTLHLAAVFTCNFVNHCYQIGDSMLGEKGLSFDMLKPLIRETAQKVMELKPVDAQTGPAVRMDQTIINKHLDLLAGQPERKKIYQLVSESIYKTQNPK